MSGLGRRVALLARPGTACDRLRGALVEAGAMVVLEADPLTLDPAALDAAQAQVLMVALDTQTEDALDRFEAALLDPSIQVIFEEAELAATREGWEAARWARHLAAKLHGHGDVLPPGAGSGRAPLALEADELDISAAFDAGIPLALEPAGSDVPYEFDALLAEVALEPAPTDGERVNARATAAGVNADGDALAAFDPNLDFSYDGSFDSVAAESQDPAYTPAYAGFQVEPGDDGAMDFQSLGEFDAQPRAATSESGFNQMFDGDFAAAAAASGSGADLSAFREPDDAAEPAAPVARPALELVSADDDIAASQRRDADAGGEASPVDRRFKHDLASLDARIAGMELVDDRIIKGPAQANGAVLVMAGIGGPDAVRQLLAALPVDFPRPVLVQQHLDGGRYDKLVAQMQRATALPVKVAEPRAPAIAGVVYILPAGIGVSVDDTGIQFSDDGADVLAALPSADSALLLLSGSDPALIDAVMNHSWAGALVLGQAPDGCYDAAAPSVLAARGGDCGPPAELARRLSERWRP